MDANSHFARKLITMGNVSEDGDEHRSHSNGTINLVKAIMSFTLKAHEDCFLNFNFEENQFPSSNVIDISSQNLTNIPNEISNLMHLKALYSSQNFVQSLPKNFGKLKNLVFLDLSHNMLESLPNTMTEIVQLRYLNISHNNFSDVPSVLYKGLQLLRFLDLSFNKIEQFELPPFCIYSIINLNLSHNQLDNIPKWIFQANCNIENVDMSFNSLTQLDNHFLSRNILLKLATNLRTLNLQNCSLTSKNLEFLSNIRSLETLRLNNHDVIRNTSRNYFKSLTNDVFDNCSSLKNLIMCDVEIPCLPMNFGNQVKSIQYLDLENNFLSWLPDSFCELPFLKVCRLSSNSIFCLPKNIGNLTNLKEIYLSNNKFSEVPDSFKVLINLEYIDFYSNNLEYFDPDIINIKSLKGIDLEFNYLNYIQLCGNEQKYEQFNSKYKVLKDHYRKHISEDRFDCQKTVSNNVEVVDSNSSASESDSEDISGVHVITRRSSSDLENWDSESVSTTSSEDDFDPNVNDEEEYTNEQKNTNIYDNNFCPADTHFPSIVDSFLSLRSITPEDTNIEGQYDLD